MRLRCGWDWGLGSRSECHTSRWDYGCHKMRMFSSTFLLLDMQTCLCFWNLDVVLCITDVWGRPTLLSEENHEIESESDAVPLLILTRYESRYFLLRKKKKKKRQFSNVGTQLAGRQGFCWVSIPKWAVFHPDQWNYVTIFQICSLGIFLSVGI